MESKPSSIYGYLMMVFSIVVLAWAVWAMYSAFNFQQEGNMESFYFYAIASSIAIVLAVSSIMQMRRRIALLQSVATKVLSDAKWKYCLNCRYRLPANATFCDACGARQAEAVRHRHPYVNNADESR